MKGTACLVCGHLCPAEDVADQLVDVCLVEPVLALPARRRRNEIECRARKLRQFNLLIFRGEQYFISREDIILVEGGEEVVQLPERRGEEVREIGCEGAREGGVDDVESLFRISRGYELTA